MKRKKTTKEHDLKWWKKKADKFFSLYIRRKYAHNNMVICVTCGVRKHWKEVHCGHYISRNHLSTRFDKRNVAPQCPGCNLFGSGKHDVFALALVSKYGKDILEDLNAQKNKPVKYTIAHYQDMIDSWQDKLVGFDIRDGIL